MATPDAKLQKTLEKVSNLVKLAQDDPDSEESRNAAVQACALMKQHELVLLPRSEIERAQKMIDGAKELAREQGQKTMQNYALGAIVGAMLSKQLKLG